MRKLIIIAFEEYIRNYIGQNVFQGIADSNTWTACGADVKSKDKLAKLGDFVGEIHISEQKITRFNFTALLLMYNHRRKSSSFHFRFKRNFRSLYFFNRNFGFGPFQKRQRSKNALGNNPTKEKHTLTIATYLASVAIHAVRAVRDLPKFLLVTGICRSGLLPLTLKIIRDRTPVNPDLEKIISQVKPDLIIYPSSAFETLGDEIIRAAKKNGRAKTLYLIDNWDNLSSKSIFPENPDYLGVWGPQSLKQAIQIHGMAEKNIHILGTPRYEVYYDYAKRLKKRGAIRHPYVLFAGCAVDFEEISALAKLNDVISEHSAALPKNLKILYRPHPWGNRSKYLRALSQMSLKHVVVDPQIAAAEKMALQGTAFQPDLDYYPQLLDNCLFVICPLSTMIIETTIMKKMTLVLCYDDGVSITSPDVMLKNYLHFEKLENLGCCFFVHELEKIGEAFHGALGTKFRMNQDALNYYIHRDNLGYPKRLQMMLKAISKELIGTQKITQVV